MFSNVLSDNFNFQLLVYVYVCSTCCNQILYMHKNDQGRDQGINYNFKIE